MSQEPVTPRLTQALKDKITEIETEIAQLKERIRKLEENDLPLMKDNINTLEAQAKPF